MVKGLPKRIKSAQGTSKVPKGVDFFGLHKSTLI